MKVWLAAYDKSELIRVEVTNEIGDGTAGIGNDPVRRLHGHVVNIAHNNFMSVAALNGFLPIRPGNDFSAQINASRPARENEDMGKVVVAFRGGSYVAALDAT